MRSTQLWLCRIAIDVLDLASFRSRRHQHVHMLLSQPSCRRTLRYKARPSIATSEPLICLILLQLLLCQVDRALQLALCHLASTRAYLPNTQQLCRRSKSGKQRRCLLRSPAEWFSRYSSSTPHLPKLLPPLRMRCVRTSNACVHGMLGHVQLFFSCGVQIGVSFVVGPHERHGEYLRHDIVACYGIV